MNWQLPKNLYQIYQYRSLFNVFVFRDFKARYRYAGLGSAWAVLQPLSLMIILTIVFSRFFKVETNGIPYPIFSYSALLPWMFISKILTSSGNQFMGNRKLITRIYFPREIIPLSTVGTTLIDFSFGIIVFLMMLMIYQIPVNANILFVFLILPVQILLGIGIALLTTVLTALFRDLQFVIPLLVQIWMYASPVIYSVHNLQSKYLWFFYLNPLTGIIEGYRDVIIKGQLLSGDFLISSVLISLILTLVSYSLFKRLEPLIVDII